MDKSKNCVVGLLCSFQSGRSPNRYFLCLNLFPAFENENGCEAMMPGMQAGIVVFRHLPLEVLEEISSNVEAGEGIIVGFGLPHLSVSCDEIPDFWLVISDKAIVRKMRVESLENFVEKVIKVGPVGQSNKFDGHVFCHLVELVHEPMAKPGHRQMQ